MATQTEKPLLAKSTVVDTDVHLSYDSLRAEVAKRMEQPHRGYVDPETGHDSYPAEGLGGDLGGRKEMGIEDVSDPETIEKTLVDEFHIDHPIINTSVGLLTDRIYNTERAIAETKAANDVLIENFLDYNDDFYGFITVPGRDPDAAVEEIERFGDNDQVLGVYLTMGSEFQLRPWGDPIYDKMYKALEDNDLVPAFHISYYPEPAVALRKAETKFTQTAIGPVWCSMLTITSLIAQGVPEKFPDLDFLILEGDITSIPHMMARLNRRYGEFRAELPLLEQSPEEYIRESFYFSTQPLGEFNNPQHMNQTLDMIGLDSIVFSSDYPHFDFDHPTALDSFLQRFSQEERDRVLHQNAADLLGMDV